MKKFVLCMSVFCSLEAQASTVADTRGNNGIHCHGCGHRNRFNQC
jgi:hypothetical protein